METGKVFKVRSKKNGLYSTGSKGGRMGFTKNGKAWSSIGHVKSMLRQFDSSKYRPYHMENHTYDDLEVVTFEVNETETVDVIDIIK